MNIHRQQQKGGWRLASFKEIKIGEFFQDSEKVIFDSKHVYLKLPGGFFLDLEKNIKVKAADRFRKDDMEGTSWRFNLVKVKISVIPGGL